MEKLTPRQTEVLQMLSSTFLTRKEIAERLCIEKSTVDGHAKTIFSKLGVSRREDLFDPPSHRASAADLVALAKHVDRLEQRIERLETH